MGNLTKNVFLYFYLLNVDIFLEEVTHFKLYISIENIAINFRELYMCLKFSM